MADWAGLQHDLLFEIGRRLTSIESYQSFVAVCRSWRAAAADDKGHLKQKTFQGSFVMLAEKEPGMRRFLNVSTGKIHKIFLPETSGKHCLACQDWLLMVGEEEDQNNEASLLHLVSRIRIPLPKPTTFPIHKFVLSDNPTLTSNFIVAVLWGDHFQIGFCKTEDVSWTEMDWHRHSDLMDIKYDNNKLYALDCWKRVVRCDGQFQQVFDLNGLFEENNFYMVEFTNKILIVRRTLDCTSYNPLKIYEVDMEDGKMFEINHLEFKIADQYCNSFMFVKCPEIKDLANKALFLGHNSSYLVESWPDRYRCNPNCIYFSINHMKIYFGLQNKILTRYDLCNPSYQTLFYKKMPYKETPTKWIGPRIY